MGGNFSCQTGRLLAAPAILTDYRGNRCGMAGKRPFRQRSAVVNTGSESRDICWKSSPVFRIYYYFRTDRAEVICAMFAAAAVCSGEQNGSNHTRPSNVSSLLNTPHMTIIAGAAEKNPMDSFQLRGLYPYTRQRIFRIIWMPRGFCLCCFSATYPVPSPCPVLSLFYETGVYRRCVVIDTAVPFRYNWKAKPL